MIRRSRRSHRLLSTAHVVTAQRDIRGYGDGAEIPTNGRHPSMFPYEQGRRNDGTVSGGGTMSPARNICTVVLASPESPDGGQSEQGRDAHCSPHSLMNPGSHRRGGGGTVGVPGAAIGTEPMISPRNLNPGERSRDWVWFIVPEATVPVEFLYVAPPPQFRIPLDR